MKTYVYVCMIAFLMSILASACKKDLTHSPIDPNPNDSATFIQLEVKTIPLTSRKLYALISLNNAKGEPVVSDRKLALDYIQGKYMTDKIKTDTGIYSITKFLVVQSSDTAEYATPKKNSPKAQLVNNPLSLPIRVPRKGLTSGVVEVLKIGEADQPEDFGYTDVDFGNMPYLTVQLALQMKLGNVVYDSLRGDVTLTATDGEGLTWTRQLNIDPTNPTIRVPRNYSRYTFQTHKWNKHLERSYSRNELHENYTIVLEGNASAKKLLKETTFLESVSGLLPESRTEYYYDGNRLSLIKNYQKSLQASGLHLTNLYEFSYRPGILDTIYRYDGAQRLTGYTAFTYTGQQITGISNKSFDQQTHAVFEHHPGTPFNTIKGQYLFGNGHSMIYYMRFANGNKISESAQSSTGGAESASFEYDDNINPYFQIGYPDLYFTNSSKNNMTAQDRSYSGAVPSAVPYKYEYSYDADGYPTTAYVSYKGGTSQQHLYRIRKEYLYQ